MNKTLEEIKAKAVPTLKKAGVVRSSIFGSYVRGENRADSDIDVLVELPKGNSLFDLIRLEMELEKVLGKKVDLLTYNSLSPYLKDRITKEQIQVL